MYPTIYHMLKDLTGLDLCFAKALQSFGFFVVLAFATSYYFIASEFKRKEGQGIFSAKKVKNQITESSLDWINIIVWFLFGHKFGALFIDTTCTYAEDIRGFLFSTQGNFITGLVGAVIGYFLAQRELKLNKAKNAEEFTLERPHHYVGNMIFIAALSGILGAKIFHLLENPDEIPAMFTSIDSFFSGLTIYGGLIVATFFVSYYNKSKGLNMLAASDAITPSLFLGYGIGRLGCQFSGDGDWGIENLAPKPDWLSFLPDWAWSYQYPNNVIKAGERIQDCVGEFCYQLPNPVWPTALYEAAFGVLAFAFLWSIRKHLKFTGMMTALYLIINGFERFWIEKIRVNTEYNIGSGITQAEIISTVFFLAGVASLVYILRNKEKFNDIKKGVA